MNIQKLKLKNFRCFKDKIFTFDSPFVVIEGKNGSGKTTILEALHYACYLRSFRTRSGKELINFEDKHFFIQLDVEDNEGSDQNIQVGFADNNKLVKLNKKPVNSYKELLSHYRVIAAAEDDLELIKGAPEFRRVFLDQAIAVRSNEFLPTFKNYKKILSHRNSLLFRMFKGERYSVDDFKTWSKQLWEATRFIQKNRIEYLKVLECVVNKLRKQHFDEDIGIVLKYLPKAKCEGDFEEFWKNYDHGNEVRYGRSLFGAHLDDFSIKFRDKKAKVFASRGQQKLVVFLIKTSQLKMLLDKGHSACILLDDFLTDLDEGIFNKCIDILLTLECQVFVTCPLKSFVTGSKKFKPAIISL